MSKLQHTSGPWVIDYSGTYGHIKSVTTEISKIRTPTVCIYRNWALNEILPEGEIQANARLIAAAPEMLEALIEFNKLAHCSDDRFAGYSDIIYHNSKEIIEKATGMSIEEILK